MKQRRVGLYARVSTNDQNPEAQLQELRQYAARRGFLIVKEYVDTVTGDVARRKKGKGAKDLAYQQLMADARARRFDIVLVWKFDRFARSLPALIEGLQKFSALGIDFISATQDVDTTTSTGRLFFHMVGAFAEFEREMIVERVNAGLANARAKGVQLGRPPRPGEARVLTLRAEGHSISQIALKTKRSRAGVRLVLGRAEAAK